MTQPAITIPWPSLVLLVGPSGCGKSTFAAKHFKPTEVLSSDYCRGLVSDDETNQDASKDAFEVLYFIASKRLTAGKLVVVDATNVQPEYRKALIDIARKHDVTPIAIVLNLPKEVCLERNKNRPHRQVKTHVILDQSDSLHRSLDNLKSEGISLIHILNTVEEVESAVIELELSQ